MKFYILFFLSFLFYPFSSFAFVEMYSLFGPEEQETINGPGRIDSEYYSDLLAFRQSLNNDFAFLKANNAYDIYVGSVSSTQFAIQQRLKLNQQISEKLFFDLAYIERENLEEGRKQFISGLTYKFSDFFSASSYTSLFANKDQNDIGFAGNFNLTKAHKFRLFINLIDFGFNERNQIEAKDQKKPLHFGIYGQWTNQALEFFEYYLFQNTSVIRDFTQVDQRYTFDETRLGFRGKKKITQKYKFNFDFDFFNGKEGQFALTTPDPVIDIEWNRSGLRFLNQIAFDNVIFGLEYNYRYWSSTNGHIQHSNLMPHLWYNIRLKQTLLIVPQSLDLGLETSIHEGQGPENLRSDTDKNSDLNSRLNIKLYYEFSKTAILNLLLSADLDDGFSWEGGGGQFQILF